VFGQLVMEIFKEFQNLKAKELYFRALSIVNAKIYIACMLFKHPYVVLH